MTDKQRALKYLEAEQRGRALGVVGQAAATMGEWMEWLWTTPGTWEAMNSFLKTESPVETPPTTTYSRLSREMPPSTIQAAPSGDRPQPEHWEYICVTVQNPTDGNLGVVEEGQYAVAGDEVLIADLDGRTMGARRLGPDDDPAVVARRFLRARAPKRSPLIFPDVGVV